MCFNIAQKYKHVREGMKSVMGGKVLEHEAKTILREGWRQGLEEGFEQGRREGEDYGRLEQAKATAGLKKAVRNKEESFPTK